VTTVYPDDPNLHYTEFAHASIDHRRARFTRPGPPNPAVVASPGTRVNFRSDARAIWIRISYRNAPCGSTGCGRFSLEVDGVLRAADIGSDLIQGWRSYRIFEQSGPEPHDFSLIFPYSSAVDFRGLELAGGSRRLLAPAPGRPGALFVAYGDSITQGAYATAIVRTYPHQVAAMKAWSVINMGFGGEPVVEEDGTDVGELGGGLVTVAIGINDYNLSRRVEATRRLYGAFLDNLRAEQPETPVYCITPLWTTAEDNPNALGAVPEDYRREIRSVVTERMQADPNLHLIEGLDLVPHSPSFFVDGLHPNDAGFASYALNLAARLPN
jgi:hypothetical protein